MFSGLWRLMAMTILALQLAGCAFFGGDEAPAENSALARPGLDGPLPEVDASQQRRLTFINSDIFDRNVATLMSSGYERIVVDVAGNFSLDVVPERMEKWLSVVQESDGLVKAEALPDPNAPVTRSAELVALFQVAYSFFNDNRDEERERANYRTAERYHARLYYRADSGNVLKVVFHRR